MILPVSFVAEAIPLTPSGHDRGHIPGSRVALSIWSIAARRVRPWHKRRNCSSGRRSAGLARHGH